MPTLFGSSLLFDELNQDRRLFPFDPEMPPYGPQKGDDHPIGPDQLVTMTPPGLSGWLIRENPAIPHVYGIQNASFRIGY